MTVRFKFPGAVICCISLSGVLACAGSQHNTEAIAAVDADASEPSSEAPSELSTEDTSAETGKTTATVGEGDTNPPPTEPPPSETAAAAPADKGATSAASEAAPDADVVQVSLEVATAAAIKEVATAAPAPQAKRATPRVEKSAATEGGGGSWTLELPVEVAVGGGYREGYSWRDVEGGTTELAVEVRPVFEWDWFRAPLDVSYSYRETFGYELQENEFYAAPDFEFGLGALKLTVGGKLRVVSRPGWPDLLQPEQDVPGRVSGLLPTDRHSYTGLGGHTDLEWAGWRLLETRLRVAYDQYDYLTDANFDPILEPMHLTPSDRRKVSTSINFAGANRKRTWKYKLKVEGEWHEYQLRFARDAQTGITNSLPGGQPPNPLQEFLRLSVRHRQSLWLRSLKSRLAMIVRYERNIDTFDNYYTWNTVGAEVSWRVRPFRRTSLKTTAGGFYRLYTEDGYFGNRSSRPPLDDGDDVRDRLDLWASANLKYRPRDLDWTPFVEVGWQASETNFPDYVPFVYPQTRAYDIDYDFNNWWVFAGVSFEMTLLTLEGEPSSPPEPKTRMEVGQVTEGGA